jgi:cohesin loading factor subunit SCC2
MVLHYVSKILKEVVPLMEHPSESFLAALEEDLVKLTMKHGQLVWSFNNRDTCTE